jgi:transposase InsO family protein
MRKKDTEWALFWCSLLKDLLFGDVESHEVRRTLKDLASTEHRFPDGKLRKPSLSTLKRKLKLYRARGFEALARKQRADRGRARKDAEKLVVRAIELKKDQPRRSDETINQFLQEDFKRTLPKSTLYRHLKAAGATRLKLGIVDTPVRCRWTRDHTHDLWVGDFEEGPYVLHEGESLPTHLSAWIDCHSRFVVEGRYYLRQNTPILIDSLLRAFAGHGVPRELYVDNAKVYLSNALTQACYRLGISRLMRPPGDPAAGGLIERLFLTTQQQFESEVRAGHILTLDQLNRAFTAWLEMSYHRRKHSEIQEPPLERYQRGLVAIRMVDLQQALECFFTCVPRTVHRDFSDVQIEHRFYRVDSRYRGDKVLVRYDPFGQLDSVLIYSLNEEYLGKGTLHQRQTHESPPPPSTTHVPKHDYLGLLVARHEQELKRRTQPAQSIDFRKLTEGRIPPFQVFAKTVAWLLGRKGLSDLTAHETELLHGSYLKAKSAPRQLLEQAAAKTQDKTVLAFTQQLALLLKERNPGV